MNSLDYYNRQKDDWTDNEIDNLSREYLIEEKSISEIADIHRRTPGKLAFQLVRMKIISKTQEANGYDDYKKSQLYNEIVQLNKSTKAERPVKERPIKERPVRESIPKSERLPRITRTLLSEQLSDIQQKITKLEALSEFITGEIRELKSMMNELNKSHPKPKKLLVSSTSMKQSPKTLGDNGS